MANNISSRVNEERSTLSSFFPNRDDRWVKWSVKLCGWFLAVITVIPAFSIVAFAKANDALKKRKVTPYPTDIKTPYPTDIKTPYPNEINPFSEGCDSGEPDLNPTGNPLGEAAQQEQEIRDTNNREDEAFQSVEADTQELIDGGLQTCDARVQTISEESSRPSITDFEQSNELSREVEYLHIQVNKLSRKVLNLEEEKTDLKKQNVNLEQENVGLKREIEELKESNPSKPSYDWGKHQKTRAERAELSSRKSFSTSMAASRRDQLTADQASKRSEIGDLIHSYKRIRLGEGTKPDEFCEKLSTILFDAISKNRKIIKSYRIDDSRKHVEFEIPDLDRCFLGVLFCALRTNPKNFRGFLKSSKTEIAFFTYPEAKELFKKFLTKLGGSTEEGKFETISNYFSSVLLGLYISGTQGKDSEGIPPLIRVLKQVKSSIEAKIRRREIRQQFVCNPYFARHGSE